MSIPGSAAPFLLASEAAPAAYEIERSLRFNSSDSAYLSRTPASAGNRKTWTWAGWVKRTLKGGVGGDIFSHVANVNSQYSFYFDSDNTLGWHVYTGSFIARKKTSAVYRDPSAWYHIVAVWDTTNATAADRMRIYVNGTRVTTFSASVDPALNLDSQINNTVEHGIGTNPPFKNAYNDIYFADIHFLDGITPSTTTRVVNGVTETILTDFGEFDDNGIWQPIEYSGTYGTNGFHLPFSDNSTAAALGTDTSGNGNTWSVNNISVNNWIPSNTPYGVSLNNSTTRILTASNSDYTFGTGPFTIEFWYYPTAGVSQFDSLVSGDGSSGLFFAYRSGYLDVINNGDSFSLLRTSWPTLNTWSHIALSRDSSTIRLFVNGTAVASANALDNFTQSTLAVGNSVGGGYAVPGIISDFRYVKGVAVYTSNFSRPTTPLTAIANTKLLTCNSATVVDSSGLGQTLTVTDAVVVNTLTSPEVDSLVDVPTNGSEVDSGLGGNVRGNYCTWNPLSAPSFATLTNGNLDVAINGSSSFATGVKGTVGIPSSGKWYWEVTVTSVGELAIGVVDNQTGVRSKYYRYDTGGWQNIYINDVQTAAVAGFTTNDIIGVGYDADNSQIRWYKNGTQVGTNYSLANNGRFLPFIEHGSGSGSASAVANFGQRPFAYTAPSGFKALCTANLPAPVVTKANEVMDVALYTGNGSTQTISGLGFSPDLVWIKTRNVGYYHVLYDIIRGTGTDKALYSNTTDAEGVDTTLQNLTAFNSDGFSLGTTSGTNILNNSSNTRVAWCWDAGSSTVTNTQGSITSQVRANASAGFSVITWTGQTAAGSIGHGLGVAPSLIICKARSNAQSWGVYHKDVGINNYLLLDSTGASTAYSGIWGSSAPTSTVFGVPGNVGLNNNNGWTYVAYCFAPVAGYSLMGSYVGNGSASDGPFVYTGMRPRYLCIKSSSFADQWIVFDAARNGSNVVNLHLHPNLANNESSLDWLDFTSNGFKIRTNYATVNQSGGSFIYFAFAESPFAANNRAR